MPVSVDAYVLYRRVLGSILHKDFISECEIAAAPVSMKSILFDSEDNRFSQN